MKKVIGWLVILILISSSAYFFREQIAYEVNQLIYFSYCDNPIRYRIGEIDPRFNITASELKTYAQQASQVWSNTSGKQLFVFDPQGALSINMVYDKRQQLKKQIDKQDTALSQGKENIEPQIDQFEKMALNFRQDVEKLNEDIQYWNSQGGAPPDVYEQLITKQNQLQDRSQQLQQMAASLKRSTDEYNQEVSKLNQTIDELNEMLEVKPEEGLYDPINQRIDIYFNVDKNELITTITHELGHALGLEHTSDQTSIMYHRVNNSLKPSTGDIQAVYEYCKERNRLEIMYEQLSYRVNIIRQNLTPSSSTN